MTFFKTAAIAILITVSAGRSLAGFAYPARTMKSSILGKTIDYSLIVPMQYLSDPTATFPVLFALHGHGAQYTAYTSMQTVKDAVEDDPMLVVAFNAGDNYYVDVTEFFFDEFVPFIDSVYRTTGEYAVTGFSMGGYGAFHFMLTDTDMFKSVSAKSGAFYSAGVPSGSEINPRLATVKAAGTALPPMYLDCGTADTWISNQRELHDTLTSLGYAHEYHETAGAAHDWTFWSAAMADIVPWHGQYFDYSSSVRHRGTAPATAGTAIMPNPSRGTFSVAGIRSGSVVLMTTDGAFAVTVPVVDGMVNWRTAVPGLADGVYVITREDGAALARVMLVR